MTNFQPLLFRTLGDSERDQVDRLTSGYEMLLRFTVAVRLAETRPEPVAFPRARMSRVSFGGWLELAHALEKSCSESQVMPLWRSWLSRYGQELETVIQARNQLAHTSQSQTVVATLLSALVNVDAVLAASDPWGAQFSLQWRGLALATLREGPEGTFPDAQDAQVLFVSDTSPLDLSPMLVFDFPKRDGRPTQERRLMLFCGIDSRGRGLEMDVLGGSERDPFRSKWNAAAIVGDFEARFEREDWVEGEAPNLRGRDALLMKLLARVQAHRESGAKVPLMLAAEPGSGKTALLAAMTRQWHGDGYVAAYAPRHAKAPGLGGLREILRERLKVDFNRSKPELAQIREIASKIEKLRGTLTIVLDGLDECPNPDEFARAAIMLAQDGHTVIVGCRPSVRTCLPDAVMLLPVGESLRFAESDFVSWIRDEVPTDVARKLDERRGQKWLREAFNVSEGLALYVSVIVQRLGDGSLQPQGTPPTLDEEWDRMLSNAGALDDSGRLAPLLLVGICQMPSSSWHEQKTLAAFLDADPALSMPLIRDFLDAAGQPFHELLREFVLSTPRLARTRELARERWLSSAFMNPIVGWPDLPELAHELDAHEEGWRRLVEGGAFLPWLSRECFGNENWVNTLARWTQFAGDKAPAELRAWLSVFRKCAGCDWAVSTSARRTKSHFGDWFSGSTADFILDRIHEQGAHADFARRVLEAPTEVDAFRPCRRVNRLAAMPDRFQFVHDVIATGIGSDGVYLAALGSDGELSVDSIADGHRHLHSFATGVIAETVWLAVSDKLQAVAIGHDGAHPEITVVQFKEQPPQVERYAWGNGGYVRLGSAVAGGAAPSKVFAMPHGLLAYLEGHANPHDVDEAARDQYADPEDDPEYEYNEAADLTARRPLDGESSVVEVHKGFKKPLPRDSIDRLLAVDGHVARLWGKRVSIHDSEGAQKFTNKFDRVEAPPDGPFHFASSDKLLRIVCDGATVRLEEGATWVSGNTRNANGGYRKQVNAHQKKVVWVGPSGVETDLHRWPTLPVSTLRCEVNDNHLVVRNASGAVVADWWGRVALYSPVMIRADRIAVLEGDALVVLSIDLPS